MKKWLTKCVRRNPCCGGIFDWDNALRRLDELNALSENPDLWNEPKAAQALMKERNYLAGNVTRYRDLEQNLQDNMELIALGGGGRRLSHCPRGRSRH